MVVSAVDPLNLVGIISPGDRVPAIPTNRVVYRDGVPVAARVAGAVRFFQQTPEAERPAIVTALRARLGATTDMGPTLAGIVKAQDSRLPLKPRQPALI